MKKIVCEMCGGTDFIKQDGVFVCQSCGVKYSIEEARKMMTEVEGEPAGSAAVPADGAEAIGPADVSGGTVRIDQSAEVKNLYELARRARNDNNSENAQKYYEQILLKDPGSWEANFYSVYYQSMNCNIAGIESAANRLSNCEETVLKLVKDNVADEDAQKKAVDEMAAKLMAISVMLSRAAQNHYGNIDISIRDNYTMELLGRCCAAINICYYFGNHIEEMFGSGFAQKSAVPCWKIAVDLHKGIVTYFMNKEAVKQTIMLYVGKIQRYDSSYATPEINTAASGGCYVATAVYGSYDCPQVWTLRRYRDDTLAQTPYGRAFIHIYYAVSPTLVKWFGKTCWFKKLWKAKLDRMVAELNAKGVEDTPYEDRKW